MSNKRNIENIKNELKGRFDNFVEIYPEHQTLVFHSDLDHLENTTFTIDELIYLGEIACLLKLENLKNNNK